jgi:VCBS repeat-containing protein
MRQHIRLWLGTCLIFGLLGVITLYGCNSDGGNLDTKTDGNGSSGHSTSSSNNAPVPTAPSIVTAKETAGSSQVRANDPDTGQTHTFALTTVPAHGNATVHATGLVTYTPAADFTGTDSLVVTVTDTGTPALSGTVTISVRVFTAATPADLQRLVFRFADGGALDTALASQPVTLAFGLFTDDTGPFTLTASHVQGTDGQPASAAGTVVIASCELPLSTSTFIASMGPQAGDVMRIDPCEINPDNGGLILEHEATGVRSTSEPPQLLPLAVTLTPVATGLSNPVYITHAGDTRLFIVEQPGRIQILHNGTLLATPFLDIVPLVSSGGERGLLSMAFHPDYASTGASGAGLFWVNYTDINGDTVIARYTVSPNDRNVADPASARILLTIAQPFANHNGGQLQFGPVEGVQQKRYLYIGMGDGGSSGDPRNNAQNDATLLGKLLRLDPSTEVNPVPPFYTIPPDNPNAAAGLTLGIIWGKGLRNPWRFSFDALTGDLYIADVGQNRREEVNVTPAGTPGGLNYGWRIMEGLQCFNPPSNCDTSGLELPVFDYAQTTTPRRCSIIGGYVYRGTRFPLLLGTYFYADLCSGEIFGLAEVAPDDWENTLLHTSNFSPLTFGEGIDRELYIGGTDGNVYQVIGIE